MNMTLQQQATTGPGRETFPRPYSIVAACTHDALSVRKRVDSPFVDHATSVGQCLACGTWIHRVEWKSRDEVDDRLLTAVEIDALQALEDRYRRSDAR